MRFVSWNIQQGGGSRATRIVEQIAKWNPDIIGLSEFQDSSAGDHIANGLRDLGLGHQVTTVDAVDRGRNFLFLASRIAFETREYNGILARTGRWLHAVFPDIEAMLMHVPNRDMGNKGQFLDSIAEVFAANRSSRAVAFGDTNSGVPGMDDESGFFAPGCVEDHWFRAVANAGWRDVWRDRNPAGREYTWYSTKGNGFRLDQAFASPVALSSVKDVRYDWGHGGREAKLSDHAAIVLDVGDA
ncbi:MAG: endonuclease/exonuclease/phosphatase family protein [bacterium]|nr:endonuclease/exonuclease/phosphatase family protein [bacterium]